MMTNQIGVARTILANLPITRHSQDRGRPLLGYVPLAVAAYTSSLYYEDEGAEAQLPGWQLQAPL